MQQRFTPIAACVAAIVAAIMFTAAPASAVWTNTQKSGSKNCTTQQAILHTTDSGTFAEHRWGSATGPRLNYWSGTMLQASHNTGYGTGSVAWYAHATVLIENARVTCVTP